MKNNLITQTNLKSSFRRSTTKISTYIPSCLFHFATKPLFLLAILFLVYTSTSAQVAGCTDQNSSNYNPIATIDDGYCYYPNSCDCNDEFTETLFIADGSGVSSSAELNIDCFEPEAVLSGVNDILSLYVNMEHSYSGDLGMYITAPNGVQVQLFAQSGGSTWFGEATDFDATATNPGEGMITVGL